MDDLTDRSVQNTFMFRIQGAERLYLYFWCVESTSVTCGNMGQTNLLNSDLKVLYYGAIVGTEDSVVPSNTQTVAYSFNVDAGVYIAFANIRWSSNAKGSRHIGFAEKTTEAFADMNAHYSIVAPSTDGMTFQNLAVILKYENPAHVDIRVQQFSGGDLKIRTRLSLLKVK